MCAGFPKPTKGSFLLLLNILLQALCGPLVFSEIMYDPAGTDSPNEFVELVNRSTSEINLTGWRLLDLADEDSLLGENRVIWPGQYVIIFEGDYDLETGIYAGLIPDGAKIFQVNDNTLGNGLGNGGDSLFLVDTSGATVASIGWEGGGPPGYSLEKVILEECSLPDNWRVSRDTLGTPGNRNSVYGQVFDLSLDSLTWVLATPPDQFSIDCYVSNRGLVSTGGALQIAGTTVDVIPEIAVETQIMLQFSWMGPNDRLGYHHVTANVNAPNDYRRGNDSLDLAVYLPADSGAVVINEIMAVPAESEPEWIELLNLSGKMINLEGWLISDPAGDAILPQQLLAADEYMLVTGDSTWVAAWPGNLNRAVLANFPILNDNGDIISITAADGSPIDHVDYNTFGAATENQSHEKILPAGGSQPNNWSTSRAGGGTPGEPNSVYGQVF
ncbi:MAG: lamin tail domain-containing protein, partial [Candidatus Marinimicrobia bacterium]|nr:lamin tail domain-containing protein [Candidatus Neomarinimicrobiota bacterium]